MSLDTLYQNVSEIWSGESHSDKSADAFLGWPPEEVIKDVLELVKNGTKYDLFVRRPIWLTISNDLTIFNDVVVCETCRIPHLLSYYESGSCNKVCRICRICQFTSCSTYRVGTCAKCEKNICYRCGDGIIPCSTPFCFSNTVWCEDCAPRCEKSGDIMNCGHCNRSEGDSFAPF